MAEGSNDGKKKPKGRKDSLAETLNRDKMMVAGLRANAAAVGKRGIDDAFVDAMSVVIADVERLNTEQEALKGALKSKTAEMQTTMRSLAKMQSEAKKTVKLAIDKTRWVEFGMTDKQ